jgi:cytochrome b
MSNHVIRVWDLPTRLFHWGLVACVVGLVATAYVPGSWIEWHARLGYAVLALLLFRLVWGFVGGRWSRFSAFLYSPRSILAYVRGQGHPDHLIGHNPLGAFSVFAMKLALLVQVATGLVSDDEIAFQGPLNRWVDSSKGLAATWYHKDVGQWLVVALVVLHVLAIAFYQLKKKENLIGPMLHGDKPASPEVIGSRDDAATRLLGALVLAACVGAVLWLIR